MKKLSVTIFTSELVEQVMWTIINWIFWIKEQIYQKPHLKVFVQFLFTLIVLSIILIQSSLFDFLVICTPRMLLTDFGTYIILK